VDVVGGSAAADPPAPSRPRHDHRGERIRGAAVTIERPAISVAAEDDVALPARFHGNRSRNSARDVQLRSAVKPEGRAAANVPAENRGVGAHAVSAEGDAVHVRARAASRSAAADRDRATEADAAAAAVRATVRRQARSHTDEERFLESDAAVGVGALSAAAGGFAAGEGRADATASAGDAPASDAASVVGGNGRARRGRLSARPLLPAIRRFRSRAPALPRRPAA